MKQFELFGDSFPPQAGQIALEDIFAAYYECRRNKRQTANAIAFELNFEQELIRLWQEINSGTYKIGRSIAFIVKEPVQREVFAANFRDRVVHHLVIAKINPLFEQSFIPSSYSCRAGKGTLYGVRDVSRMIKECSAGYSEDCYILKLDIRSFFMSIDKNILYRMLKIFIEEKYSAPDKYLLQKLLKKIIFYNPEDNCFIKGSLADWNGLPCHKSLFWSDRARGLPIGNLTSQIFANFYLDKLDKYVTKELGFQYYGRYVDDFVLIHRDKSVLLDARRKIEIFLQNSLHLTLHPQKVYLQHYSKGVRFIGAVIKPYRIYIGNRTKRNLYQKIYAELPPMSESVSAVLGKIEKFSSCVNSYLGFMRHYNTFRLRSHILSLLNESFLGEVMELLPHAEKFCVNKLFLPPEQKKRQLRRQRGYRRLQRKKSKGEENGLV